MVRKALGRLGRALSSDTNSRIDSAQFEIAELRRQIGFNAELRRQIDFNGFNIEQHLRDLKMLTGKQAALAVSALESLPNLGAAGFRVSSQWGEDGILEWLLSQLPMLKQTFVEFGVEHYAEANTPFY